jgi:type I restriction enzyme, S subunit
VKWPMVALHDICRPKQWPTISSTELRNHGYPVYGANGKIGHYDKYTHEQPTILITCRGATCGTINVCEPFSYVNGNAMALDDLDERVSLGFLAHYLRVRGLGDSISGSAQPQITRESLRGVKIPLPPLEEQRRIAAILDKAGDLCHKRRAALQKLDSLTQSLFLDMFGDPGSNPNGWPRVALGTVIANGPQNGLYKHADAYGTGTPILRIDAFYDGGVTDYSKLKRLRATPEEVSLYRLNEGDIVVNRVNSMEYLGKSALITGASEDTVFESNMMRFAVDLENLEPRYLIAFLQTGYIKKQILQRSKNAVNQSSINQDDVKSFTLTLPPICLQRTFASRVVAALGHLKDALRSKQAMESLLASLQQRAFRGEL